jgi:hypothetical protein
MKLQINQPACLGQYSFTGKSECHLNKKGSHVISFGEAASKGYMDDTDFKLNDITG